jgi:hypothetical protein
VVSIPLAARPPYRVVPDVGQAAWISCAGHLPYGQPLDQRLDDAASLTWDVDAGDVEIVGNAIVQLTVSADQPVAFVALRLSDVDSDGTSTLVTRGLLNLTRRSGMAAAEPLEPGTRYPVVVELEATAWRPLPGHWLRLAVAGADWPNVAAPPVPLTLQVHGGELRLPVLTDESPWPTPSFAPGEPTAGESADGVTWRVERDVLRRSTACVVEHGSSYPTPYGSATESYTGRVCVDSRTFQQDAHAEVSFSLRFDQPGAEVVARSVLDVHATAGDYEVTIGLVCTEGGAVVGERRWHAAFPRDLA